MKNCTLILFLLMMMTSCVNKPKITVKEYPQTNEDTSVVENYFGTDITDPYRWMEDDRSQETTAWVRAENEVTDDYLSQIPYRDQIRTRLTELYDYPKYGNPRKVGDYYFFFENNGLQNQSVLYYQKGKDGKTEVFLDPNTLSSDGTVALSGISFSKDDKYMAYSVSKSGSDWVDIYVMEIDSRKKLEDKIEWVKFSTAQWSKDGFYYSRYDEPAKGKEYSAANEFQKVYFHKLGTSQKDDKLIYEDKEHPLRYFSADVSDDDKYLFIIGSEGTSGNEVIFKEIDSKKPFKTLFKGFAFDYYVVSCIDDRLLVHTNDGASNFRLVEVFLNNTAFEMKDIIAQSGNLLEGVSVTADYIFASYLKDASNVVEQLDLGGTKIRDIELPAIGTASGFGGKSEKIETFYTFTSFNYPPTVFSYNMTTGKSEIFRQSQVKFNPEEFVVEQVFFESKDKTKVPMFITYKKGMLSKDGSNPLHLYAYGGFNISLTPSFSPVNIMFMEQGGVYVLANIRGGGEYGETWHKGGMLESKQNVFDDFISAAEYLIKEKYTSSEKLAISGGSNGGLLVGACITQRPDLYAVSFPIVGVLDMLRYQKFTIGWGWAVEYGSSDNQEQFDYLIKYSPLHNIKKGTCYPATMIMTADHDDRVVPAHSFKFGATLQKAQGCDNPILLRIDSNAGHGAGKPMSKIIDEKTDMMAFLFWNTNTTLNLK